MKMYFKKFDYARLHYSGHKSEFKEKRDGEFRYGVAVRQVLASPTPVFRAVDTNIYFVLCDDGEIISTLGKINGDFEPCEERIFSLYLERGTKSPFASQSFSVEIARDFYFVRGEPVILIKTWPNTVCVCRYGKE